MVMSFRLKIQGRKTNVVSQRYICKLSSNLGFLESAWFLRIHKPNKYLCIICQSLLDALLLLTYLIPLTIQ